MILSFSLLGQMGRLGNQLFQIASTLGLAEKHGAQAAFPAWEYEQYFETPIPHGPPQTAVLEERRFHHYDWPITESCDLRGYLQSEKYFGSTRLALKPEFVQACKKKVDIFDRETICIQVRRGDFVGNPNYYPLPPTYYLDALLAHFPDWREANLLFISDDIEYCRTHFEALPNAHFSRGLTDIEDMALATNCDHFIISNSTFGWWCAWLGEKPHSKIVHSGHLFAGRLLRKDARDVRPERWTAHHKDDYRLDLTDLTFTIPLRYDHEDRKGNLELTLCMLQKDVDAHFIICEQGGDHFAYTAQWARYVKSESPAFHRTKMLNDMAGMAETPYIANWDCDVLVPPAQLLMAVLALREGADMVFPYDGRFARMPRRDWFPQVQKSLDIGIARDTNFKNRYHGHNSVGGAVLWNKEAFIDGGMENEHFVSFGPEDCERHDRFKTLGFRIHRVAGSLFHMDHYVGPDSSPRNPHFRTNKREYDKVHKMGSEELRAYIDTWPWRNPYTTRYYNRIMEGAVRSAEIVMAALPFRPGSVVDIGCGPGAWQAGVEDYVGVDFGVRPRELLFPPEQYVECDLEQGWPELGRRFDLALCLEVAEHLSPERAEGLVACLCSLSDRVLFSAAIPYQGGTGHVNEQFQTYWAELFRSHGYGAAKKQPDVRDCAEVELWYRQNLVLYERGAKGKVEDYVLPVYYLQIARGLRALAGITDG